MKALKIQKNLLKKDEYKLAITVLINNIKNSLEITKGMEAYHHIVIPNGSYRMS